VDLLRWTILVTLKMKKKNSNAIPDPFSKLISLDGLSKNKKDVTEGDKRNRANAANSTISTANAFSGVDGFNKVPTDFSVKIPLIMASAISLL